MPQIVPDQIVTRSAARWYPVSADRLFEVYEKRDLLIRWFGPTNLAQWLRFDHDLRVDGQLCFGFAMDDGQEFWGRCDYLVVDPGRRIEYVNSTTDRAGLIIAPLPDHDWLLRVHTIVSVVANGRGVTLHVAVKPHDADQLEQAFFAFMWPEMKKRFEASFDVLSALLEARGRRGRH